MLFGKKKKKNTELDAAFLRVAQEIQKIDERDNPKKIEHYILDSCEHIVSTTKEVEKLKTEYRSLSGYLGDVDKIIGMDSSVRSQLIDMVDNVAKLSRRKRSFKESKKRLSDEEFVLLQEREDVVVTDIRHMEENERYRSKVDRDVKFLEAEKSRWEIEKDHYTGIMKKIRFISMAILMAVVGLIVFSIAVFGGFGGTYGMILLLCVFGGVCGDFLVFLYMGRLRRKKRLAIRRLNQSISLLNVERMRYANVTKAIIYEQRRYDVRSSGELAYLWEQYVLTVKEKEAYRKNNLDLAFFVERLFRLFKELDLKYEKRWLEQVDLMLDGEEMQRLHDHLYERRIEVESRIAVNNTMIKTERDDIDNMMKDHDFYVPEVMEIISSVDKICGLTALEKTPKERSA